MPTVIDGNSGDVIQHDESVAVHSKPSTIKPTIWDVINVVGFVVGKLIGSAVEQALTPRKKSAKKKKPRIPFQNHRRRPRRKTARRRKRKKLPNILGLPPKR